jgi:hypothetical protein
MCRHTRSGQHPISLQPALDASRSAVDALPRHKIQTRVFKSCMDHFESIIATLLEDEHYWVRRSFKIDVTREEKRQVGKHSIPRPEIDLLALGFSRNEVIAFEVKSFLDSPGVRLADLQMEHEVQEGRYKLFTSRGYPRRAASRPTANHNGCLHAGASEGVKKMIDSMHDEPRKGQQDQSPTKQLQ